MKGDFSRSTFKREKHYSSVRMQQGRVQVDADWNEQADIQEHLRRSAVRDLIGQSGAPVDGGGFKLELTPDKKDFIIHPGRFYVDGILCELEEEAVEVVQQKNLRLDPDNSNLSVSGLDNKNYAKGQWVEVFYNKNKTQKLQVVSSSDTVLVLQGFNASIKEVESGISIRRLTTYNHQPYSPETSASLSTDSQYLAYLDVWYRHVTDIDDASIRELALGGPDTASRIQTIWQVKLRALTNDETDENYIKKPCSLLEYKEIIPSRHARIAADVGESSWSSDDCTKVDAGGYYGLENHLYRMEIHDIKKKSKKLVPRFKWSRDNGSTVREIKFDNSTASISEVEVLGRDVSTVFVPGLWIEITDELNELQEKPGVLVLTKIVNGNQLSFNPPAPGSDDEKAINTIRSRACKPRIRLWDCVTDSYPLEGTTSKIDIEKGIKVKFMEGDEYKSGDYWLIPARTIDSSIEWEKDINGNGKFLERLGIKHHYCAIAKVTFDDDNEMSVSDVRHTFGSLTTPSLYYAGGDGQEVTPGNPLPQPLEVCVKNGPIPVEGAWVKFAFKIPKGNGRLIDSSDKTNESADWIKVRTNSNSIASCYCTPNSLNWNTDSSIWHQQVEAILLDADCGSTGNVPSVHFNASLSVAGDVAYSLPDCTPSNVTCTVVGTNYQYWYNEQNPVIDLFGEKYVPLLAKGDSIWKSHINKLAKLVRDDNEKYTLKTGDMLDLGSGYSLQAKQVDVDGKTVWLEFIRDGEYIDDKIISVADGSDSTWDVQRDNIQDEDDITVLRIHVNQIFLGAADSIAQIEGIWLIDYADAITLETGDEFGEFTLIKIIDGVDAFNPGSLIFESITNPNNELPTVQRLLKQKISGWPPEEDEVGNVSVKGILDTLLCKLDAGKIPYNPLINENRWKDINETSDLGKPPAPNTVQDALDNLAANLDSSDISYRPMKDCPASPTVRSLLDIPLNKDSKVNKVFDALLCNFNAAYLPLDLSDGNLCKKLVEVKTVQNALNVLCGEIGGAEGAGCCIIVKDSEQLQEALKKLKDGSTICLLAGEFKIDSSLLIENCNSIVIRGCSLASVLKADIEISKCQNVVIEKLYVVGNVSVKGNRKEEKFCEDVVIKNLSISGSVFVENTDNFSLKENSISQANNQSFKVISCSHVVIESNSFREYGVELDFDDSNDLSIQKNTIYTDTYPLTEGKVASINVKNSSDIEITGNHISMFCSSNCDAIGVKLDKVNDNIEESGLSVASNYIVVTKGRSLEINSEGPVLVNGNFFQSSFITPGTFTRIVEITSPEGQIIFTHNFCNSYISGEIPYDVNLINIEGQSTIFNNNVCTFVGVSSYNGRHIRHVNIPYGFATVIGNRCSERNVTAAEGSIYSIYAGKMSILLGNITTSQIEPKPDGLNLQES